MPFAVISLDEARHQRALDRIAALEERVKHPEPGLELVADVLEAHVAEVFRTEGGWLNNPWAPLGARTVRARARGWGYYRLPATAGVGPASPILVWTGRLRSSFRMGGYSHVRAVQSGELTWGSSLSYASYPLRRRPALAFRDDWQRREVVFQPLRLWLQGAEPGAVRMQMSARLGIPIQGGGSPAGGQEVYL